MLKGEGLSFRYGPRKPWVVRDVSIAIRPGVALGLSGPSGQGKTTLAKLLAGYLTPLTGRVTVDGEPLPRQGYFPVQLIFQHPELAINPRWRIGQVLAEGGQMPSTELMQALSLEPAWLARWPHELSGGELQRVAVARVLSSRTRYLIADEMTAMLDTVTQAQLWQAVLAHARQYNVGLLAISHDALLLERICDEVVGYWPE